MPPFRTTRFVRHSPEEMFDVVADVERYPEFLPMCESLRVLRRTPAGEGVETLVADMSVGYKAIRESFTSRVNLDRPRRVIDVEYVDGPFRHLHNRWTFSPQGDGCEVEFDIDYEFKSRMLSYVMGAVFDRAFRAFTGAFEARADRIYGSVAPSRRRAERA